MDMLARSGTAADTRAAAADYDSLEALVDGQAQVLEMISQERPLPEILAAITRWVEAQSRDGVLASLLLLDREGEHLLHGAAPSLPDAYNEAIHGIEIGPSVGSCGTAAYTKKPVIVEDIEHDPLWATFRDLALAQGLHSCWSTPLLSRSGGVLGTFAMYYRRPRRPSAHDYHLIRLVTRTAALAIEQQMARAEREGLIEREQDALRREEAERQRLHDLFMQAPALIAVLRGPAHVFELANPSYRRAIGATRDVIGLSAREVLPELQAQGFFELLDRVYTTGAAYEGREVLAKLDREGSGILEDCYFNFVYQPSRDASGRVDGIMVHAVDVTDLVRARQHAEESEIKFRALADNIPQLAWMAYADGHIFWYNRRWYQYTGTTSESQEGWGWQSVHDREILPQVVERWSRSISTGEPFDMIFPLRGADGVFRPFLTRVVPVKDENERVVRWFGTNTEVTEQVQLQEALRASEAALQEANQRKDEFLGIASHELRTPLTSAKANVQVGVRRLERLMAQPERDAQAITTQLEALRTVLRRSETSLDRLAGLVSDLLDVSRIQAGKLEMRPRRVELAEVVREAVEEERVTWSAREVRLQGALRPGKFGAKRSPVWAEADPDRIRQVVINYLSNALKYAPADRPIDVRLDVVEEPQHSVHVARFSVRDRGPGLTPEQQAQLFERFSRAPGIEPLQGSGMGLGLGLYISRTIVERHGGMVGVESTPGEGSTFYFTLPLAQMAVDD